MHNQQDLFNLVAGLLGFFPYSEAIPELPRFMIEICPLPLKTFDRTISQDEEVGSAGLWQPSFVCWRSLRVHACQSPLTSAAGRGCAMGSLPTLGVMIAAVHGSDRPQYILPWEGNGWQCWRGNLIQKGTKKASLSLWYNKLCA